MTAAIEGGVEDRVLERVRRYVERETPSGAGDAINALSSEIETELTALGARTEAFEAAGSGRNLVARFDGSDPDAASLLLLAHIDTVHPVGTIAALPFDVRDGRAYGPGIYDMKSGLAVVIEAIVQLREQGRSPRRPLCLVITCDEEVGSPSSRTLIEREAAGAYAALVSEPSLADGGAKTARKGVATYRLDVTGRPAHSGIEPERGVSAIAELASQITRIGSFADPRRGTTVNIGLVAGGTASNVIAAEATATVDVRSTDPAEDQRIASALYALTPYHPEARVAVRCVDSRPPLVRSAGVVALYEVARGIAKNLGVVLNEGSTGGGSDGSLVAAFGVPTLDGLGPRGGGAHTLEEHIVVADLPFRLALITRLLETL